MAATVTGNKTVTAAIAPHLSAAKLNTLLGTAVENLKVSDVAVLRDATKRVAGGAEQSSTLATILGATGGTGVIVTGAKTVNNSNAPHRSAAQLTTLLGKAVEALTIKDLDAIDDTLNRISGASDGTKTLGQLIA